MTTIMAMDDEELREDLDELAEELVDPERGDRTIEDQGEPGAIRRGDDQRVEDEDRD
jgi:hypothetical protein